MFLQYTIADKRSRESSFSHGKLTATHLGGLSAKTSQTWKKRGKDVNERRRNSGRLCNVLQKEGAWG